MRRLLPILICTVAIAFPLNAREPGAVGSFTLPIHDQPVAVPHWMEPPVISQQGTLTSISIPMLPPGGGGNDLAVTIYFYEPEDGFLRVLWSNATSSTTLAYNLYEGVAVPNRRTLLIPASTLSHAGVLTLQNDGPEATVYQIRFHPVYHDEVALASGADVPDLLLEHGLSADSNELHGLPYQPGDDRWVDDVVHAPVSDRIERIEGGLDFLVPLGESPLQARIAVWVNGLPYTGLVDLWINGQFAVTLSVDVPSLNDPGYYHDGEGTWHFAGWRKAVAAIPAHLLPAGENTFHFAPSGLLPDDPVSIKDMILQLRYPVSEPPMQAALPPQVDLFGNPMEEDYDERLALDPALPQFRFLISEPELNSY